MTTAAIAESAPPPPPCGAQPAFQGFSLGGTLGWGGGTARVTDVTNLAPHTVGITNTQFQTSTSATSLDISGLNGGLIAGYLQRFGPWGLGVDFLANWTSMNNSQTSTKASPFLGLPGTSSFQSYCLQVGLKNSLQLRGVFSYVVANVLMPKIILGWDSSQYSFANTSNYYNNSFGASTSWSPSVSGNKRLNGFLWGAGLDFLIAKDVVCGLEYTGVQSQKVTLSSSSTGTTRNLANIAPLSATSTVTLAPYYSTFKATLKYMF